MKKKEARFKNNTSINAISLPPPPNAQSLSSQTEATNDNTQNQEMSSDQFCAVLDNLFHSLSPISPIEPQQSPSPQLAVKSVNSSTSSTMHQSQLFPYQSTAAIPEKARLPVGVTATPQMLQDNFDYLCRCIEEESTDDDEANAIIGDVEKVVMNQRQQFVHDDIDDVTQC